jgi:hypothetical protein
MKKTYSKIILLSGILGFLVLNSCSDRIMDEIGRNPNSPTEVPINLLMPMIGVDLAVAVLGTDLAWYSSVFVEHTTGVHGQLRDADQRVGINSTMANNSWISIYADLLKDTDIIIQRGSEGGEEEGAWTSVGIAKIIQAFGASVATDLWGDVPFREALQGSNNRTPVFDAQESVYADLQALLDEAIGDLSEGSVVNPGNADFYYGGDEESWIKAAYALKARLHNRLSRKDPAGSANAALAAIANAFEDPSENMVFNDFTTDATGEHPWFQELNDRSHHAISVTIDNLMTGLNDPRRTMWFGTIGGQIAPAPSGRAENDQSGTIYSRASEDYLTATSPLPIITYDELKFIEAEALLRLNQRPEAYAAYLEAIEASLVRANVTEAGIGTYLVQSSVAVGANNLTLRNIIEQKYISFWLFQPIEAYNDYRRTGFPVLMNSEGPPPNRFPYPQDEIAANTENVPNVTTLTRIWWAE